MNASSFLGLIINKQLKWKDHMDHIFLKITRIIGALTKLKNHILLFFLSMLHNSLLLTIQIILQLLITHFTHVISEQVNIMIIHIKHEFVRQCLLYLAYVQIYWVLSCGLNLIFCAGFVKKYFSMSYYPINMEFGYHIPRLVRYSAMTFLSHLACTFGFIKDFLDHNAALQMQMVVSAYL